MLLANYLRIMRLRRKGWKIGENVVIEPNVCLMAESGEICSNTHIGKNCKIIGKKIKIGSNCLIYPNTNIIVKDTFSIGDRGKISRNVAMRGYSIYFGNELWCNENVDIGGGGWEKQTAILTVGDFVHMGRGCTINVCAPVTIGSCTGIGIESMIFTHSSGNGQSILNGYKHIERPVVIGNHVSVFTRALIAPGVTVHDGATIGAMAYLMTDAKENHLYAGVPATEKKAAVPVQEDKRLSTVEEVLRNETTLTVCANDCKTTCDVTILRTVKGENISQLTVAGCKAVVCEVCETCPEDVAVFCMGTGEVYGQSSSISEIVRDVLRRNGMLFRFVGYQPSKLDYQTFIVRGIERE